MTTPTERTRALRRAWEFLWGLQFAANLTHVQRRMVKGILAHYPTPMEISAWAQTRPSGTYQILGVMPWLEPETADQEPLSEASCAPNTIDRQPITPMLRMLSLFTASACFRRDLQGAKNLTAEQHRERVSVCRHFPLEVELEAFARSEGLDAEIGQCKDKFIHRGMTAMDRTVATGDSVPAETAITRLETKLTTARKFSRP